VALIRIQSSPLPAKPWNSASPRRGALSRVKEFLLCFPVPRLPSDPERNPCTPPGPDNGNDYNPAISSGTQPLPSSLPSIDGRQSDGFWALNLTHGRAGDRGPNVYALPTALRMLASAACRARSTRIFLPAGYAMLTPRLWMFGRAPEGEARSRCRLTPARRVARRRCGPARPHPIRVVHLE